ncbi:MAG: hypothetical protein GWP09_02225, partial [Nitrospiraceae bacterium]|nr:hypothetical protein [Nitrospiraceae bacterium]
MRKSIVHDKGNIIKRKSVKNLLSLFLLLSILISFILVSFSVEGRYVGEKNLITLIPAKGCYKTDNSVYLVQGGIYLNGKYEGTDYCEDKSTLVEYYCYSSSPQSYFFKRIDCTKLPDRHNYHCENGACVSDSITASKCIRHGESIYTKGYVEYEGSKFEDYCDTNQYLVQYKCINGRPIPDELSQPCGYGCENGACLNQGQTQQTQTTQTQTITTSIQSNDCSNYQYGCYKKGGVNSQEKGYICENGYYMGSDNCAGGSYPTLLNEWVCENNKAVEKYYDCEMLGDDYICQNGACVLPNQPENWNWSNFIIDNQRWQSRTHDWFDMIMPQSVKDSFKQARDNSIRWLETNLGGNSNLWNAIFEGDYAAAICSVFFPMSTGNSVSVSYPSPQAASTFALMATKQKQTMPDGS